MADAIHNFTTSHLAFFRPIRRTYYVIKWDNENRKWCKFTDDLPNLILKRSSVSTRGRVNINVARHRHATTREINVLAEGYYLECLLQTGLIYITLVKNEGQQLQQLYMEKEYTITPQENAELINTTRSLWSIAAAAPPAPAPAAAPLAAAATQQQVRTTVLKPIPERIAWLIAEDASKNKETCPITSEEISPVTAAVTTCFHVFENDAIQEWFNRNPVKTKCPMCREVCLMTAAFSQ
jgi:hypothetical protein